MRPVGASLLALGQAAVYFLPAPAAAADGWCQCRHYSEQRLPGRAPHLPSTFLLPTRVRSKCSPLFQVIINLPPHIQLLSMSATVRNPDDLGGWITQVPAKRWGVGVGGRGGESA